MNIKQITETIIRGEPAMVFPLRRVHTMVWDDLGHHIFDVRGWGYIQYHGEGAEELQDAIGDWIVRTLNAEATAQGLL